MDRNPSSRPRAPVLPGVLALVAFLFLASSAAQAGVVIAPTSCVSTTVFQCSFSCPTSGWVSIVVTATSTRNGDLVASGAAVCEGASPGCSETGVATCEDSDWTDGGPRAGFCDLTVGTSATCSFTASNFEG